MDVLLMHNPDAGAGDTSAQALQDALAAAGHRVRRHDTDRDGFDPDVGAAEVVVVAGGDGTVAKALRHFAGTDRRLAILPIGGANNVATSLGISTSPATLARGLSTATPRRFRLCRAEGPWGVRHFVEAVGIGLLARTLSDVHDERPPADEKIGRARIVLRDRVRDAPPGDWSIRIDGAPIPGRPLLVEALNIAVTGPSLRLAPHADPGDDLLDLAVLPPDGRDAFADALARDAPLPLRHMRGRVVEALWADGALRIDDDFLDPPPAPAPIRLSVTDRAVTILVPPRRTEAP